MSQWSSPYDADYLAKFRADYGDLDAGIAGAVLVLRHGGVETYESCEGGAGHAYTEPTVRFHGAPSAGWHALSVAFDYALPVDALKRVWTMDHPHLPTGPTWELVFREQVPLRARAAENGEQT